MQNKQTFIFSSKNVIYGLCSEIENGHIHSYPAYRYEFDSQENKYIYQMTMKKWKTLEYALMYYGIRGIVCFPIEGERPDSVTEDEMLKLVDKGFDDMLKQATINNQR